MNQSKEITVVVGEWLFNLLRWCLNMYCRLILCWKPQVRCTHITLFVIVCFLFCCCGFAIYNSWLLWRSCLVKIGAAGVEGLNGVSLSSLPASWKWLRTNVLEAMASIVFISVVHIQKAGNCWHIWSLQICFCRSTQKSCDTLTRGRRNELRLCLLHFWGMMLDKYRTWYLHPFRLDQTSFSSLM